MIDTHCTLVSTFDVDACNEDSSTNAVHQEGKHTDMVDTESMLHSLDIEACNEDSSIML